MNRKWKMRSRQGIDGKGTHRPSEVNRAEADYFVTRVVIEIALRK